MSTLKRLNAAAGTNFRRWTEVAPAIKKGMESSVTEEMQWPTEWTDRGRTRRFDDFRNYPAAEHGFIYDRQIALALGHKTVEYVRSYYLYVGPDQEANLPGGPPFPEEADTFDGRNLLAHDEKYNYYCTEADARRICGQIKAYEQRTAR